MAKNNEMLSIPGIDQILDKVNNILKDYHFDSKIENYFVSKVVGSNHKKVNRLNNIRDSVYKSSKDCSTILFDGKKEFFDKIDDKFYVVKCNSNDKINLFLLFSLFYLLDNFHDEDNHYYIGLDFEFNEKSIALCQISFFPHRDDKYIFVVDPNDFNQNQKTLFIERIFRSPVIRLLHGSDALDTPYMFDNLFEKNIKKISDYIQNVIDTRFLCEYYKSAIEAPDRKCSIYNALLFFKVISEDKFNELQNINQVMGPENDMNWNIKNMSSYHLRYAAYDVLYLKKFFYNMLKMAKLISNTTRQEMLIVPYFTRLVFLEKYDISHIIKTYQPILNNANNFFIKGKTKNMTFVEIVNNIISNIQLTNMEYLIKNLFEVNFFRKILRILFNFIVYNTLFESYTVYKSKKEPVYIDLSFNELIKHFKKFNFIHLIEIVNKINDEVQFIKNYNKLRELMNDS